MTQTREPAVPAKETRRPSWHVDAPTVDFGRIMARLGYPLEENGGHITHIGVHEDVEESFIIGLLARNPSIRRALGIRHDVKIMITSSGMPRAHNFPGIPMRDLHGDILEDYYGVLGIDQWGGQLDSHKAGNTGDGQVSSIGLVVYHPGVVLDEDWVAPAIRAVSRLDSHREALARQKRFRKDPDPRWPHTQTVYSNVIKAWRLLRRSGKLAPEKEILYWVLSYLGASELIQEALQDVDYDAVEQAARDLNVRDHGIFLTPNLIRGVRTHLTGLSRLQADEAAALADEYEAAVNTALTAWEAEWTLAQSDYHEDRRLRRRIFPAMLQCLSRGENGNLSQDPDPAGKTPQIAVFMSMYSTSARAGEFCRERARYLKIRSEYGNLPREVIVHITRPGGQYTVVAQSAQMHEVAAVLRTAEANARGATFPEGADPRTVGNFYCIEHGGEISELGFLAPFTTGFGDFWDTNPDGIPSGALHRPERERLIEQVLRGQLVADTSDDEPVEEAPETDTVPEADAGDDLNDLK